MDLQLNGRRAIVTGGSGGIGRLVAQHLATEGCHVAIVARTESRLSHVAAELDRQGAPSVVAVPGDTSADDTAADVMSRAIQELDGVDILVNAATGRDRSRPVRGLDDLDSDVVLDAVNDKVQGYVRCARATAPHMKAAGWGRIINIAGITARQSGSPLTSVRNAAVVAITKHLAQELGPHGVNVTAVHPGLTYTERTPGMLAARAEATGRSSAEVEAELGARNDLGRLVTAAEVADVITFLASPRSVAVNGDVVPVGGGVGDAIHY